MSQNNNNDRSMNRDDQGHEQLNQSIQEQIFQRMNSRNPSRQFGSATGLLRQDHKEEDDVQAILAAATAAASVPPASHSRYYQQQQAQGVSQTLQPPLPSLLTTGRGTVSQDLAAQARAEEAQRRRILLLRAELNFRNQQQQQQRREGQQQQQLIHNALRQASLEQQLGRFPRSAPGSSSGESSLRDERGSQQLKQQLSSRSVFSPSATSEELLMLQQQLQQGNSSLTRGTSLTSSVASDRSAVAPHLALGSSAARTPQLRQQEQPQNPHPSSFLSPSAQLQQLQQQVRENASNSNRFSPSLEQRLQQLRSGAAASSSISHPPPKGGSFSPHGTTSPTSSSLEQRLQQLRQGSSSTNSRSLSPSLELRLQQLRQGAAAQGAAASSSSLVSSSSSNRDEIQRQLLLQTARLQLQQQRQEQPLRPPGTDQDMSLHEQIRQAAAVLQASRSTNFAGLGPGDRASGLLLRHSSAPQPSSSLLNPLTSALLPHQTQQQQQSQSTVSGLLHLQNEPHSLLQSQLLLHAPQRVNLQLLRTTSRETADSALVGVGMGTGPGVVGALLRVPDKRRKRGGGAGTFEEDDNVTKKTKTMPLEYNFCFPLPPLKEKKETTTVAAATSTAEPETTLKFPSFHHVWNQIQQHSSSSSSSSSSTLLSLETKTELFRRRIFRSNIPVIGETRSIILTAKRQQQELLLQQGHGLPAARATPSAVSTQLRFSRSA